MSGTSIRSHQVSITVEASTEPLYDLISDITRTGEWSPVCRSWWWDDEAEAGRVGAWLTGHNELPHRTWETRSEVVAAEHGREFAWVVGGSFVRWGFTLTPAQTGTTLTESWQLLPGGIAMFDEKFGDQAHPEITDRTSSPRRHPEDARRDQADCRVVHRRKGAVPVMTGLLGRSICLRGSATDPFWHDLAPWVLRSDRRRRGFSLRVCSGVRIPSPLHAEKDAGPERHLAEVDLLALLVMPCAR